MPNQTTRRPPSAVLLSPGEAASLLRVSLDTIVRAIHRGDYPNATRVGQRQYRIPASDLGVTDHQARAYLEQSERVHT